jgi:hypothetical protein
LNQKYFRSFILIISTIIISGCVALSPQAKSFNEFVVKSEGLYKKGEISPIEHYSSYYENVKTLQTPVPAQKPVLLKYGLTMLEHAEDLVDKKITRKEFDKLERRAVLVLETENVSALAVNYEAVGQEINSRPNNTNCTVFNNHINCNSY